MSPSTAWHASLQQAMAAGPAPSGNLAIPIYRHGSMEAELYRPEEVDPQTPHNRDEIYIVAQGEGLFFDGENTVDVKQGSFIFVPAGTTHRFLNFTTGFAVWVIFYGRAGGETDAESKSLSALP